MSEYKDLRQHLGELEKKGLLFRVRKAINKDTELHPLVRWQFRGGIREEERKAFLFENIFDSRGKKFDIPVVVGALAGSKYIYAAGLGCSLGEINDRWQRALACPIEPVVVSDGPVHEVVETGSSLEEVGFDRFPIPISTPGFDNAPYTTCSHWFTKDPETGVRNVGNYRGHLKARNRIGISVGRQQHAGIHRRKWRELGKPMPAALVVGGPPVVSYAAVQKVPYGVDEMGLAGGLAGEPVPMVRCKTIDLEVPRDAEIVFEGLIDTEYLEEEGPFGESHGYMNPRTVAPFLKLTAITHRRNPTWVSFISQVAPSESSVIKRIPAEALFLRHLREELSIKSVTRVAFHEPLVSLWMFVVVQFRGPKGSEVSRALHAVSTLRPGIGRIVVGVDEDIDPENLDAVIWALGYRMKPHRDLHVITNMERGHGPPFASVFETPDFEGSKGISDFSHLLIDATLKEPFPPVSLPKKQYMERAREIWEQLDLPRLRPESPWYGYSLGQWSEELEEEADLAVKGEYYQTGEKVGQRRVKG